MENLPRPNGSGLDREVTEEPWPSLNLLPELALVRVFSFLSIRDKVRVESVCKRWLRCSRASWIYLKEFSSYPSIYAKKYLELRSSREVLPSDVRATKVFLMLVKRMRHPITGVTSLIKLEIDHRICPELTLPDNPEDGTDGDDDYDGDDGTLAAFRAIARFCPYLENLEWNCSGWDKTSALSCLFGLEEEQGRLPTRFGQRLRHLSMTGLYYVDDSALRPILDRCPRLRRLEMPEASSIRGSFLPPRLPLRSLDLSHGSNVDDRVIAAILDSSSVDTLVQLVLNFCRQITGGGLEKLGLLIGRKKLEILQLRNNFRDADLDRMFAEGENRLRVLDISYNYGVTDDLLCRTLALLPELNTLSIVANSGVTNWFLHNWFKGGGGRELMVGRRRKFAPLNLRCFNTRIAENQMKGKEDFAWTLSIEDTECHL